MCDYADARGSKRFRAKTYDRAISVFEGRRSAYREALTRKRNKGVPLEVVTTQVFFETVVLDPRKLRPRSRETYESTWNCYHAAQFGYRPIDDLESLVSVLQTHLDELEDKCLEVRAQTGRYNPLFIRNVWTPLRRLLILARTKRRWDWNPAMYLDLPEVPDPMPHEHLKMPRSFTNVLDREDVERILLWVTNRGDACSAQDAATIQMAFELCLRRNEPRGFRIQDVDLARRKVTLWFQVDDGGRIRRPKYVKPDARPARFPIGRRLASTLERLLAEHPDRDNPDAFLLFDNDPLKPMRRDRFRDVLMDAQHALGMLDEWGDPLLTPHGLRHSGITHLARMGVDIYELMHWARHAEIRTTRKYIHLVNDEHLRSAGETFDR